MVKEHFNYMGNPSDKNKLSTLSIHSQHNPAKVHHPQIPLNDIINSSVVMNASCRHFDEYLLYYGLDAFNVVHGIFSTSVSQEALKQKVSTPLCEKSPSIVDICFKYLHQQQPK